MAVQIDHIILPVNDAQASIAFYTQVLGFTHDGDDGPFAIIRVSPDFMLLLVPWGTEGGEHLAFAMSRSEFDAVFRRLRDGAVPYGDRFDSVGNMKGPGDERGARGPGKALYFFDPSRHLIEIRYYAGRCGERAAGGDAEEFLERPSSFQPSLALDECSGPVAGSVKHR